MAMLKVVTEKELDGMAWDLVEELAGRKTSSKACVVFLKGDLGAGKTTFTKVVARTLNIEEEITSPTFVIMKVYPIKNMGEQFPFDNFIHVDAYRLKSYRELQQIKFDEYLFNPKNIIFIEWPEMVEHEELSADIFMKFTHSDEVGKRVVEIA